ncbi:MAG: DUF1192 domain-containing protein [Notoacmeibacter sp.]|nr:DUF1192 domain-containing protein [Notoacmeibacter sp.]MCC0032420.1 DUF1192 domain-containing protein [Brucellaceae bacterium]
MAMSEDEPVRKPVTHAIGQDLSDLSVDELQHRIGLLESEIARLAAEVKAKGSSLSAAEALFSRK